MGMCAAAGRGREITAGLRTTRTAAGTIPGRAALPSGLGSAGFASAEICGSGTSGSAGGWGAADICGSEIWGSGCASSAAAAWGGACCCASAG